MPRRKPSSPTQPSNISMTAAPFWYVIPSNALTMSSSPSIGCRMRRAVTSESWSIAPVRDPARWTAQLHSGFQRSTIFEPIHVANASLSQMSFHHAVVT